MGIDLALENNPRFTESVMPYIQRNFDKVSSAFRGLGQPQLKYSVASGAEHGIPSSPVFVPGVQCIFDITTNGAPWFAVGVADITTYVTGGGWINVSLQQDSTIFPNTISSAGEPGQRGSFAQVWAGTVDMGQHGWYLTMQKGINAGDYRLYGGHSALLVGVWT